jgi:heptosyltransferase I
MHAAASHDSDPSRQQRVIARLLVVRLSAMGDVLHALPAVAALRAALPSTMIGWVVEERWADLIRNAFIKSGREQRSLVDQVHTFRFQAWRHSMASRGTWQEIVRAVKQLRTCCYDTAVDFQGAVRSSVVARLSNASTIYGFAEPRENAASMFYTKPVLAQGKHVIEQNLSLAAAVTRIPLQIPDISFRSSTAPCVDLVPVSGDKYVIMNPGAGWGAKRWPAERYGEVAKRLFYQLQLSTFINVGPGEEELMRAVQISSEGTARPVSCSPSQLVEITRSARLFIGGDTGPMHLAAALHIPVVAIFGPTDPARTGPFGTRSIVLRNPNSRTNRSHHDTPDTGMLEIDTEQVVSAANQLLRDSHE